MSTPRFSVRPRRLTDTATALMSVLLLSAGWWGVSGLPLLVALVPLLALSERGDGSRRAWWRTAGWAALIFGLWSAGTIWWIWYATPVGPLAVVPATILLSGGSFMLYHTVLKRAPRTLAYAVLVTAWVSAEWWMTEGEISFPWLMLGNGFAREPWAVQWYAWTGIFGGTLWVLLSNVLVYEAWRCHRRALWIAAAVWVAAPLAGSAVRYLTYPDPEREVRVAVLQPDISVFPIENKFLWSERDQDSLFVGLLRQVPSDVDFILLPETALGTERDLWEHRLEESPSIRALRRALRRMPHALLITGASTARFYPPGTASSPTARTHNGVRYDRYNTALAFTADGPIAVYHKSKLVVGAEKMPYPWLMERLRFLIIELGGTTSQLATDPEPRVFRSDEGTATGSAICYESVYGAWFAGFVARGAQFMAVITNDGWWGDTPGYRQHFSFSRLRAIETRRAVARSANTGISGFITARGEVHATLGWDERGVLTAPVGLSDRLTFYTRYGDYVARIACYVLLLSLLYFVAYRFRRRNHLVD